MTLSPIADIRSISHNTFWAVLLFCTWVFAFPFVGVIFYIPFFAVLLIKVSTGAIRCVFVHPKFYLKFYHKT